MRLYALSVFVAIANGIGADADETTDVIGSGSGPTTAAITASTFTFEGWIATRRLTVTMDSSWTTASALAEGDITEVTACW